MPKRAGIFFSGEGLTNESGGHTLRDMSKLNLTPAKPIKFFAEDWEFLEGLKQENGYTVSAQVRAAIRDHVKRIRKEAGDDA